MDTKKNDYEISFLVKTPQGGSAIEVLLQQYGSEIVNRGSLAEMSLAYPIKKNRQAYFGFLHFKAPAEAVAKLKDSLELNSEVLRSLVITPPIKKNEKKRLIRSVSLKAVDQGQKEALVPRSGLLTNEALEEKLEEILK